MLNLLLQNPLIARSWSNVLWLHNVQTFLLSKNTTKEQTALRSPWEKPQAPPPSLLPPDSGECTAPSQQACNYSVCSAHIGWSWWSLPAERFPERSSRFRGDTAPRDVWLPTGSGNTCARLIKDLTTCTENGWQPPCLMCCPWKLGKKETQWIYP